MTAADPTILDDNLQLTADGTVACRHCGAAVGTPGGAYLDQALWREQPSQAAGSDVVRADPALFVDRQIVLRQAFCPSCYIVFLTEIVPADEPRFRSKTLAPRAST